MRVFVLNKDGKPLMPTFPVIARLLLKEKKAKVVHKTPFTIKLLYETTEFTQPITAGMDTGSVMVGCAAISGNQILYQSEVILRNDIKEKMTQRRQYRRTRRTRKTRYREPRFDNRGKEGKIAPSIRSKIESHIREKNCVESILPVSKWIVETASFDIHKITNPTVEGIDYQNGDLKGFYNVKQYVLFRDNYTCQYCFGKSKDKVLECHHIIFRKNKGTDTPKNLIVLCQTCHQDLHAKYTQKTFPIHGVLSKTKHATEIGIIKSQLRKSGWIFEETFGYLTKFRREQILKLPKTHSNDAIAICCNDYQVIQPDDTIYTKKHVAAGDYQQTTGKRSEKKIPTEKLFGLRKFDLIKTIKGIGFVKGKRSSGYFAICDIFNKTISSSVKVKSECIRLQARKTTLVQLTRRNSSTR
ncbi:RNA-guided endonuclease IscB [uncultured Methanomethylovorans sp.]|uniref:RNA-guided endonuclease IscB n=1 Tax=uncultured Methanomethylovorans sp. TaxID=183759 RepID=UPI002AA83BA4|nr:RNA-guided endonuclease IscB [uncultured Methanomethylovorans sp.]